MATILIDSFDHYATANIGDKWTDSSNASIGSSSGRRAGSGAMVGGAGRGLIRTTPNYPTPSGATCVCGSAFKKTSAFTGGPGPGLVRQTSDHIFVVMLGGSDQVWVRINADATMSVVRSTQAVLGTTTFALQQNVWAFIELKVFLDASVGTVDLHVNGTSWLSLTSQNTRPLATATWNQFQLGGAIDGTYDDFYLLDGSGSFNKDFLGDVRIDAIFPESPAGAYSEWTSSSGGANYTNVDETTPNDDTDYNYTSTVGNRDSFNFPDVPAPGATIYAVQASAYARKVDSGSAELKITTRIAAADYAGTGIAIATDYNYARQLWERMPTDGITSWTSTDVNNAEFGYKKSA